MIRIITRYFISLYCFFIYTEAELRVKASSIIGRIPEILNSGLDKSLFGGILGFHTIYILLPSPAEVNNSTLGVCQCLPVPG